MNYNYILILVAFDSAWGCTTSSCLAFLMRFSFLLILLPLNRNVFMASASIATAGDFHPSRTPRQMPSLANPDELEEVVAMDQHLKKNCRCLARIDGQVALREGCSMYVGNKKIASQFSSHTSLFFNGFCHFNASIGWSSSNGHVVILHAHIGSHPI